MDNIDVRVTLKGQLAQRFRKYIRESLGNQRGAQVITIRQAVEEFLDRRLVDCRHDTT